MVPMGLAIDWPAMSGAEPWMLVGSRCDAAVWSDGAVQVIRVRTDLLLTARKDP